MALQFIDGFCHYFLTNDVGFQGGTAATGQKWDSSAFAGEMYPQIDAGRFSGNAMRIRGSGGSGSITKNVTTPKDEMIVGVAWKPGGTGHTAQIIFRDDNASSVSTTLSLIASTGNASVVSTNGFVNEVTGAPVLQSGVWQYLEFRLKVHATLGEIEVKLNEVVILTATGLNTGATGDLIDNLVLAATNDSQLDHMDDLYLLDKTGSSNNDFLGGCRIDTLHTVGNGGTNDFTLFDDGAQTDYDILTNSAAVRNEGVLTIGRDHNYVESGIVGASEDYDNDLFVTASGVIFGVQVVNNARSTSTGVLTYKDEMVIAGTPFDNGSTVIAANGDYSMSTFIRDTDPSDDATWTAAKVNAVGSGFTIVTREI